MYIDEKVSTYDVLLEKLETFYTKTYLLKFAENSWEIIFKPLT